MNAKQIFDENLAKVEQDSKLRELRLELSQIQPGPYDTDEAWPTPPAIEAMGHLCNQILLIQKFAPLDYIHKIQADPSYFERVAGAMSPAGELPADFVLPLGRFISELEEMAQEGCGNSQDAAGYPTL